jgi:hypothetical protein
MAEAPRSKKIAQAAFSPQGDGFFWGTGGDCSEKAACYRSLRGAKGQPLPKCGDIFLPLSTNFKPCESGNGKACRNPADLAKNPSKIVAAKFKRRRTRKVSRHQTWRAFRSARLLKLLFYINNLSYINALLNKEVLCSETG